ncbi:tRNA (guanine(46)-N(7))-methyltransferase TrmB [Pleionea litopenaei]|uniref:tRNA (guanine(46)-N(7))-methyltransferase n=1 Tax=Pleionea litopenaei TaxID=3070815 RepID=A0AA51X7S9_9GAMM|nr:methyltransferase domain-containing protein [Pleionea sp. HL-JVS1]WMS88224.1 methyltransferase domain-containing protein [Pleionea sp. HL-JVS1]
MEKNSREITSDQEGVHGDLLYLVEKYVNNHYLKPIQNHNKEAFVNILSIIQDDEELPILDSCCGTGMSSFKLAERFPERRVIGIDQSAKRLSKQASKNEQVVLVRANCEDLWRLFVQHDIKFYRHCIFYPNPWPKSEHLKRRWHGHPVFPVLKQLSEQIEVRSNWRTYVEEFAIAWQALTSNTGDLMEFRATENMTLFEKKYQESGQPLYRFEAKS